MIMLVCNFNHFLNIHQWRYIMHEGFSSCRNSATRGHRLTLFSPPPPHGLDTLILYFMKARCCSQLLLCSVLQWCLPMSSACWCWATILTYGTRQHSTSNSPANCWQRKGYKIKNLSDSEFYVKLSRWVFFSSELSYNSLMFFISGYE